MTCKITIKSHEIHQERVISIIRNILRLDDLSIQRIHNYRVTDRSPQHNSLFFLDAFVIANAYAFRMQYYLF